MGLSPYFLRILPKNCNKGTRQLRLFLRKSLCGTEKPPFEREQKMLKKITLIAAVAALLIGAEVLAARQDKGGNPQPEQKHTQKGPKNQKRQGFGPQMFGKWLDALAKAYQKNDMEKMGKLIKKMQQARQKMQKAKETIGPHQRGFREGCRGKKHQGQFREKSGWYAPQAGMGRFCPGLQHREFGRGGQRMQRPSADSWEQGFGRGGFDRKGHCMQRRDWGGWNVDVQPRDFGRWHQGRPHRGMNAPMWDAPPREDTEELTEDTSPEDFNWE
jgi:hypothetical protein